MACGERGRFISLLAGSNAKKEPVTHVVVVDDVPDPLNIMHDALVFVATIPRVAPDYADKLLAAFEEAKAIISP